VLSAARENWIWHSFRELSGVSGGEPIAACDHAGRALLMLLMFCCRTWRMCW
jgi:hypothetical protein